MSDSTWRWIAVGLLAGNIVLFLVYQLTDSSPAEPNRIPPLDPSLPRIDLVRDQHVDAATGTTTTGCYTIGPLPTLLAQQRAADRLRPYVDRLQTRQTSADRDRGWWVYLPAADRSEALALTRQLAEQGVEDYFVVAGGALENTVSVGLYENLDNARQRQSRIRALGFDAQLEVRRETAPQFWVDYRVGGGEAPPWRFIVRASPGARRVAIPCFSAAAESGEIVTEEGEPWSFD